MNYSGKHHSAKYRFIVRRNIIFKILIGSDFDGQKAKKPPDKPAAFANQVLFLGIAMSFRKKIRHTL